MKSRTHNLARFSTFIHFEGDRAHGWTTDGRLSRRMTKLLQQQGEETEQYWVLYWHHHWRGEVPRSSDHLVAYLQESCFWATRKVFARLIAVQTSLADLFQLAIAQSESVLSGYEPEQGFALKGYASVMFTNTVRSALRQQKAADLCTDWTLLRKTSQKRFNAALGSLGLTDAIVTQYQWAWDCYKAIYVPNQKQGYSKVPPPSAEQWDAIAAQFNQGRLSQCSLDTATQSAEAIAAWMQQAGKAVRAYLYPQQRSLNRLKPVEGGGEYLDDLRDEDEPQGMERLEIQEDLQCRQQQQQALKQALAEIIHSLDQPSQQLLAYYYRDQLKQQAIAQALNIQQYAVSRQLTRVRKKILKGVAEWSKAELHITPDSNLLNSMNTVLEDLLEQFYTSASRTSHGEV